LLWGSKGAGTESLNSVGSVQFEGYTPDRYQKKKTCVKVGITELVGANPYDSETTVGQIGEPTLRRA